MSDWSKVLTGKSGHSAAFWPQTNPLWTHWIRCGFMWGPWVCEGSSTVRSPSQRVSEWALNAPQGNKVSQHRCWLTVGITVTVGNYPQLWREANHNTGNAKKKSFLSCGNINTGGTSCGNLGLIIMRPLWHCPVIISLWPNHQETNLKQSLVHLTKEVLGLRWTHQGIYFSYSLCCS